MKPLNGLKTHPLTAVALKVLREIGQTPKPCQEVNPGVVNRFLRENLVQLVKLPSPYKVHKGKDIEWLQVTDAGLARLKGGDHA